MTFTPVSTPPTGASAAFTCDDSVVQQALRLANDGEFAEAEQLLARPGDAATDAGVVAARNELLEVIRRSRREYGQDLESLLAKVRASIPDVTADDVERWRRAGQVQYRVIDGRVAYFRREPSNLFRFCDEAKQRRDAHAAARGETTAARPSWVLEDHLAEVIAEAERTGRADVVPVRHRVTFGVTVPASVRGATKGSLLRVWLPYPQEVDRQRDVTLLRMSPENGLIAPNGVHRADGEIDGAPQRTVYFERRIDDPSQPLRFELQFEFTSSAYYPQLDDAQARPLPADFPRVYLAERPPHIVFTPQLREAVAKVVGGETNPLARAWRIYEFVDGQIQYCAEEEYCTIPSFATHALSRGRGDCGVQAMLFIALCRAAGIPARWQSGWETKRLNWNMHDWAEFYVAPWGWLPADPSYGLQRVGKGAEDPRVRHFYFGHQDSYRWIVNLDYGSPLHPPKPSLRSEPADFQKGEIELDGRNLYYDEWQQDVTFEWLDA